jgi:hypothetical protein
MESGPPPVHAHPPAPSEASTSSSSAHADERSYVNEKKRKTYTTQHQEQMAAFVVSKETSRAPGSDSFWSELEAVRILYC